MDLFHAVMIVAALLVAYFSGKHRKAKELETCVICEKREARIDGMCVDCYTRMIKELREEDCRNQGVNVDINIDLDLKS